MLRDFIDQYQENRITIIKQESPTSKFRPFVNSFLIDMLVFIVSILTVFILFVIIYIITGQSKLKALVATMALQRVRAVDSLNTSRQTQNCNSELLKILMILNLVIVVLLLLRKIRKSVFFQGQLCSNMVKNKIISGRYKILCFIISEQNSWKYTFVQIDRRTVIRQCYLKEKLDMGHIRN